MEYAWVIFRRDGKKLIAHNASAAPCGTRFMPLFQFKREAVEYMNERLGIRGTIRRVKVEFPS